MNACIETMMKEHDLILQVLASLQKLADRLEGGEEAPRADVAAFGRFFKDFADKCHHGKEEDRLFSKMVEAGFPRETGPVAVMLYEHEAGRAEVRRLVQIGTGSGPLTNAERSDAADAARRFVPLLYSHIQKENNILYPMAQQAVSPDELAALDESCAAFDCEVLGPGEIAGLTRLAADLVSAYPASVAGLAVFGGCGACAG